MEKNEIIQLVQLPVIEEHLHMVKERWDAKAEHARQLVCTEDNVTDIKKVRAAVRKEYDEFEKLRKAVKNRVMEPYKAFEAVYKECVTDPFNSADEAFMSKIKEVESAVKSRGEDAVKEFFDELVVTAHLDWLTFDKLGIKISMSEAKKQDPRKLKEQISATVDRILKEVEAISGFDYSDEIMVEYRETLDMSGSITKVKERHQKMQEVKAQQAESDKAIAADKAVARKVEALAPPVEVTPVEPPKMITATFKVTDTRERLIALRTWLQENGYKFE